MKKLSIYAAALALLIPLAGCNKDQKNKEALTSEDEIPVVKIADVTTQDVAQVESYTATVEADKVNNISAAMQNRIKQIFVEEGQRVSQGQKVAVLDDVNTDNYRIQVDNAKANLASIQLDYNRALELYKIGGGTKQAVDQLNTQVINARNVLASAERTLRNAQENTVLTSPISGVVTARNYDPGDMTGSLPIVTVEQVQPVKIIINISETEFTKVHKGMPVDIALDVYPDENFTGKVHLIHPTIDPQTRTFTVEITVDNPGDKVLPGMFARATLNYGTMRRVVVPDRAIVKQTGSGNKYIYIYNPSDSTVAYRRIEPGQRLGDTYEIISGVDDGAMVAVSGQARLADGARVELAPLPANAAAAADSSAMSKQ